MLEKKPFPKPIAFKKLFGPSFIILALGLGSGEIILWPYLAANHGLGIVWGAILGITFQYFMNMEIERYALIKGESVFVGIHRLFRPAVYWFIISTFIGFGLPGIIAASAKVMASVFGLGNFKWLAILFLLLIGIILSVGKTVYKVVERITKTTLLVGIPFIFLLAVVISTKTDWLSLFNGVIGKGDNFWFLPEGIVLASFLAAFAYSGAGGNLNLTQSIYIKEKGYGMGIYSQKISSLFSKKKEEEIKLSGTNFEISEENIGYFKKWWKLISIEHAFVFWFFRHCVHVFAYAFVLYHDPWVNWQFGRYQFCNKRGNNYWSRIIPVYWCIVFSCSFNYVVPNPTWNYGFDFSYYGGECGY